jgi:Uma2 family endonuclease
MAQHARKLMSASEFLEWDDGTDTRYELIDGVPWAMAPPSVNHAQIAGNLFRLVDDAVRGRRPCRALAGAGLRIEEGPPGRVYIPDLLMTCEPVDGRRVCETARLVAEVLSPSNESHDKRFKLPVYSAQPWIEEIWLVDSKDRLVQVWYRVEGTWRDGIPIIGLGSFVSHALGVEVTLDAIYELTTLEASSPEHGPQHPGA